MATLLAPYVLRLLVHCGPHAGQVYLYSSPCSLSFPWSLSRILFRSRRFSLCPLGEILSLHVYSSASFVIDGESGFSVYRLPATEGMYATVKDAVTYSGRGAKAVC